MPELIAPNASLHASYLEGWAEFAAEGRGAADDNSALGHDFQRFGDRWSGAPGFAAFVEFLTQSAVDAGPRPDGRVPQTTFWYVDSDRYLGSIRCRHRLTPGLLEVGGHIGYDVRPTARMHGYATTMLRLVLPFAASVGIEQALLTCDLDNVASRKVIEANGGVLEDVREGQRRYWVPTAV